MGVRGSYVVVYTCGFRSRNCFLANFRVSWLFLFFFFFSSGVVVAFFFLGVQCDPCFFYWFVSCAFVACVA